jgi:hypothetical protein
LSAPVYRAGEMVNGQVDVVAPVRLPFALPLPADAAPTATAVHSSLGWFVRARIFYAGWKGPLPERVRRPFVVVNAP